MHRREVLRCIWGGAACALAACAHGYPERPIRIVAPFPPASVTDVLARAIAPKLTEAWGQTIVVDNRAGAGGNLGAEIVARAAPDGYTLLMGTNGTNAINMSLYRRMPYDTLKDFAPITLVAKSYLLLTVHPSVPANSVQALIKLAKARPGELTFGSGGNGTTPHLAGELFKTLAGVDMVHVPFKGSPQVTIDLVAGRLSLAFGNAAAVLAQVRAGRLRVLAITATRRETSLPDVPTIAESGLPGFDATPWFALFAPAGTPTEVIGKLNAEVARVLAHPDVRSHFANLGLSVASSTPRELDAWMRQEIERWAKIVRASGARAD